MQTGSSVDNRLLRRLGKPLRMTERIVVTPSHGGYLAKEDELVIKLDSGAAFGTGTHPTTALCINMIENYLKKGDVFLDVGTGTGILMIAASKLGAEKVFGIDKDQMAVEIARRNLQLNKIREERFGVRVGHLLDGVRKQFDMVAANILTEVIAKLLDDMGKVIKKSGIFICSGMIERNTHRVVAKMKLMGFEIVETRTKESWVSIAAKKKEPV